MMRLRMNNPDFHVGPRRSSTDSGTRLPTVITDWWKWAVAAVVGLLVLSAVVALYFVWSGKIEADSAMLLRKAVSQLETSPPNGSQAARPEEGIRLLQEVMNRYPKSAAAAEATLRLGTYYYTLGGYNDARKAYTAYLEKNPKGQIAFSAGLGLGDTFLAERNYREGHRDLRTACRTISSRTFTS